MRINTKRDSADSISSYNCVHSFSLCSVVRSLETESAVLCSCKVLPQNSIFLSIGTVPGTISGIVLDSFL